ncbi:MAG: hypothetical protein KAR47_05995, partial [Planctomycetes bacterium]|nr:hypothetical protein [Planctomycetota bacterium]
MVFKFLIFTDASPAVSLKLKSSIWIPLNHPIDRYFTSTLPSRESLSLLTTSFLPAPEDRYTGMSNKTANTAIAEIINIHFPVL